MHYKKGVVVSDKGDKTVIILVENKKMHPKYRKYYTVTKKFHAHDEENRYKEGDTVTIRQIRPISKLKRWLCVPESSIEKLKKKAVQKKEAKKKQMQEIIERVISKARKIKDNAKEKTKKVTVKKTASKTNNKK